MRCVEIEEKLNSSTNDKVNFLEKDVEEHLQNCPACRAKAESLKFVGAFLKRNISAPKNLDARVLAAFEKHQAAQKFEIPAQGKNHFWQRIYIPVPAFVICLAFFALSLGAIYQLGKISASQPVTSAEKNSTLSNPAAETTNQRQTLVKYVEVPVTKIVKVPVVKEKQITRVIYREKIAAENSSSADRKKPGTDTKRNNQVLTEFDLKGFQTVSELKPVIIKDRKNR